jgi:hypothetical protein
VRFEILFFLFLDGETHIEVLEKVDRKLPKGFPPL